MHTVILAICFSAFVCVVLVARDKKTEPNGAILVPSMLIGGLFSLVALWVAGFGFLQGDVGMPNSPSFHTGCLVPRKIPDGEYSYRFALRYEEQKWWGKTSAGSWPARWNEQLSEYEFLRNGAWRAVPIYLDRDDDDRSFSQDNRGWHED
jgi:hypothetical protein